jgi:hypothetical protein
MNDTPVSGPTSNKELVAYLDGELNADESRRIERLLADDPRVRIELKRLDQTWELLDRLPRARVEPVFTRSTVEMVAIRVADEVEHERAAEPSRRRRAFWLGSGVMLLAALSGVWASDRIASDPNIRLLDDFSVLEHLEAYRQTPNLEFLREALEKKLFALGPPLVDARSHATESTGERRERIERLDPRDKEQIVRKQRSFGELSPVEQARLRGLDLQLRQASDADDLGRVLERLQAWLNQLTAAERAHLLHLSSPGQRLKEIEQKLVEEATRLGGEDARQFEKWWEEVFQQRLKPFQRKELSGLSAEDRFNRLQVRFRQAAAQGRPVWWKLPSPEEFGRLRERLSDEAKSKLDRAQTDIEKRQLLRIWIQDGFHFRPTGRAPVVNGAEIADEQQREFFRQLPDKQQNGLLGLPPEEMFRMLKRKHESEPRRTPSKATTLSE